MHELPSDLTHSLRSYRGSIYGSSRKAGGDGTADDVDLEKGQRAESSVILVGLLDLHCTMPGGMC